MSRVRSAPRCEARLGGVPCPVPPCRHLLVLDLDETLVSSNSVLKGRCDLILRNIVMTDGAAPQTCYVQYRPGLIAFLHETAGLFEICVFTAGTKPYADQILDRIDPSRTFIQHRLYRHHCDVNSDGHLVKDLSRLGRDLSTVAIVDNTPEAFERHPRNGVAVPTWTGEPKDTFLMKTLMPWLRQLSRAVDVYDLIEAKTLTSF